jgi:hypothetical protein
MKRRGYAVIGAILGLVALGSSRAIAQCPVSVLTTGLKAPTKIILSTKNNLLVAEQGNGPNTGRVSIIDPSSGARRTLIDGLPAGFAAPNNDPSGPAGLAMQGRTLYVAIGLGDAVLSGPLPNSFVANPNPSSPIFSSVLAIHFSAATEMNTSGVVLSLTDQTALKNGSRVDLGNGPGEKMSIDLVADFPDYLPEPRPGLPNGVRQSNPFGLALNGDQLYVADASGNTVRALDLETRSFSILTTFGPIANNRGFGPPAVEAVPDSVHLAGNQLLVTLLTGFPFPIGNAEVRTVDIATGTNSPFIGGLTSAIDVLPRGNGFLTLEFSSDMLVGSPGRVSFYATPISPPLVVANCLITPTSMTQGAKPGDLFVTEIFTGRVMKVTQ